MPQNRRGVPQTTPPGGATGATGATARSGFLSVFGHDPECVWAAPGRVNLMGEFTDVSEGWALPFALSMTVAAAAARRDDRMLVVSTGLPAVGDRKVAVELGALRPGAAAGWSRYVLGVIWAMRHSGHIIDRGIEIHIESDLPAGAGLSSSAAIECATALAANEMFGLGCTRAELAVLARHAENEYVGVPCGIMDQTISLFGVESHALLLDTRTAQTRPVRCDLAPPALTLLAIDTGVHHELGTSGYADRRQACEQAAALLGLPSLRHVTSLRELDRLTDPVIRRRARHIVTDNARVLDAVALLESGRVRDVGPLLTEAHDSLRDDFQVSCAELDTAVAAALSAGALGARMIGGGFGGSAIALADLSLAYKVATAVTAAFRSSGFGAPHIFSVSPAGGARRVG